MLNKGIFMAPGFQFELGIKAICSITGLTGTVTARAENLYQSNSYYLTPKRKEDGTEVKGEWINEAALFKA